MVVDQEVADMRARLLTQGCVGHREGGCLRVGRA